MKGPRGPRPMPTHLKLLRGNPGQRRIKPEPEPLQPDRPLAPPAYLNEVAKEEWQRVIGELFRLRLVTLCDQAPLAAYCYAFARWRIASDKIEQMAANDPEMAGLTGKAGTGGTVANPLLLIADRACRDMVRYAAEFGLTPAARSRISAVEVLANGKFDGLLAS